jgi:hypothetical protein
MKLVPLSTSSCLLLSSIFACAPESRIVPVYPGGAGGGAGGDNGGGGAGGAVGGSGGAVGGAGAAGAPGGGAGRGGSGGAPTPDAGFGFGVRDGAAAMGGAGGGLNCGMMKHVLERIPPEIIVVLDRSTTMKNPVGVGSTVSRLDEVKMALDDVVKQTERSVRWGFTVFPTVEHCDVAEPMEVGVAAMNYTAMSAGMMRTTVNMGVTGTPMQLAIRKATRHFASLATRNPKYIILGTDGLPNCLYDPVAMRPRTSQYDIDGTVQAITDARTAGVQTFVLGIAAQRDPNPVVPDSPAALDRMAVAGGQARTAMPRFYPANSRADLVQILNDITVRAGSCVFPLTTPPMDRNLVTVRVDGMEVARDATNGWSYGPDGMTIVLNGTSCEALRMVRGRDPMVEITYGCVVQ